LFKFYIRLRVVVSVCDSAVVVAVVAVDFVHVVVAVGDAFNLMLFIFYVIFHFVGWVGYASDVLHILGKSSCCRCSQCL